MILASKSTAVSTEPFGFALDLENESNAVAKRSREFSQLRLSPHVFLSDAFTGQCLIVSQEPTKWSTRQFEHFSFVCATHCSPRMWWGRRWNAKRLSYFPRG